MPTFRVVGHVQLDFVHEVEANSAREAEDAIENVKIAALDNWVRGDSMIYSVVELDDDGDEKE